MNVLTLLIVPAIVANDGGSSEMPSPILVHSVQLTLIDQAELPARVAGVLAAVHVVEGQQVEVGEVVAQLEDYDTQLLHTRAELESEIAQLKAANDAAVRCAEKALAVAEADQERGEKTAKKNALSISLSELDQLRLQTERAFFEVERAKHEFEVAQVTGRLKENDVKLAARNLETRRIEAPLNGIVVEVNPHEGEWVEPGETVIRVVNTDRLRAAGFVDLQDAHPGLVGAQAIVSVDLPGRPAAELSGKVAFVSPEADPVNGQTKIWAEIDNRDHLLLPGMRVGMQVQRVWPEETSTVKPFSKKHEQARESQLQL